MFQAPVPIESLKLSNTCSETDQYTNCVSCWHIYSLPNTTAIVREALKVMTLFTRNPTAILPAGQSRISLTNHESNMNSELFIN